MFNILKNCTCILVMGENRVLAKMMAVGAKTTCFGFSKVATSSEHERATFFAGLSAKYSKA